jgi:hypothetical protein
MKVRTYKLEKAEKEIEKELGIKTQEGNNGGTENRRTQKKTSASSQAYRLFSEGKTPLDVAMELNLKESDATRYYSKQQYEYVITKEGKRKRWVPEKCVRYGQKVSYYVPAMFFKHNICQQ